MRQVPENYLIIGDGRLARHFARYFEFLKIPFQQWSRQSEKSLEDLVADAATILILIKDDAIENFIESNHCLRSKKRVHCSGKLVTPLAASAHPLMTFSLEPYSLDIYQNIPFILEAEGPRFENLFPDFKNPHYYIPRELKALYHAYGVMSGNFTMILWQRFFEILETQFKMPKEAAFLYLQQTCRNLQENSQSALTGPFARGDHKTIQANLESLQQDPFKKIYEAFVEVYQKNSQRG